MKNITIEFYTEQTGKIISQDYMYGNNLYVKYIENSILHGFFKNSNGTMDFYLGDQKFNYNPSLATTQYIDIAIAIENFKTKKDHWFKLSEVEFFFIKFECRDYFTIGIPVNNIIDYKICNQKFSVKEFMSAMVSVLHQVNEVVLQCIE